ncbi:MAG: hypothetical protein K0S04_319 [Herbinix sp.]|jgi:hypothetical protein|nr:hypothetical protein [Herbinix sp.]
MKLNILLFIFFAIIQVLYGYLVGEPWLAICGVIILGFIKIMFCLQEIKDEIIKSIGEIGTKKDKVKD